MSWPAAARRLQRWVPTKPAPPVIKMRLIAPSTYANHRQVRHSQRAGSPEQTVRARWRQVKLASELHSFRKPGLSEMEIRAGMTLVIGDHACVFSSPVSAAS